jgi:hypothetical protein
LRVRFGKTGLWRSYGELVQVALKVETQLLRDPAAHAGRDEREELIHSLLLELTDAIQFFVRRANEEVGARLD